MVWYGSVRRNKNGERRSCSKRGDEGLVLSKWQCRRCGRIKRCRHFWFAERNQGEMGRSSPVCGPRAPHLQVRNDLLWMRGRLRAWRWCSEWYKLELIKRKETIDGETTTNARTASTGAANDKGYQETCRANAGITGHQASNNRKPGASKTHSFLRIQRERSKRWKRLLKVGTIGIVNYLAWRAFCASWLLVTFSVVHQTSARSVGQMELWLCLRAANRAGKGLLSPWLSRLSLRQVHPRDLCGQVS